MTEILIAIQARSNSTRFPKKIFEFIGKRRVLDHVIDRARSAANHAMRHPKDRDPPIRCNVAVLHPEGDTELVKAFQGSDCFFIGGPEQDVLSRYVKAQQVTGADYIVRITADCPLLLDYVIVKHINVATFNRDIDYVSNVEESCRSAADGLDCEVISKRALDWLDKNATSSEDREHVTTALRRERPKNLSQTFVSTKLDTSNLKMSIDTPEDLERIRKYYHEREHKSTTAERIFGKKNVFEL